MNNVVIPISDLSYTMERPVIYSVIKQVMDITQISHKTNILFLGNETQVAQKGSTIDDKSLGTNIWPWNDKVIIEVTEEYDKERILNIVAKDPEQHFIFLDKDLKVYAKPICATAKVTIKVIYRANDENKASKWLNDMVVKTAMYRDTNLHDITYSYTIPETMMTVLDEIWKKREAVAGYGEDFLEYFTTHFTTRGNTVSNLNGESAVWVVSERQSRIIGRFDVDGIPEKAQKEGDSSAFTSEFSYVFTYEKPIEINLAYPSIVHNQELEEKFITARSIEHIQEQNNSYSFSGVNLNQFQSDTSLLKYYGNKGLAIPDHDSGFIGRSIPTATARVFTGLCQIAEDDKRTLLNLNDLGDFVLHKSVIDYIKHDKDNIVKLYKSVLNLSLYEDGDLMMNGILEIDDDLNVYSTIDLDLRKTYRVRMGLIVNLHFLNNGFMKKLREYGLTNKIFIYKIAATINSVLRDIGNHPDIQSSQLTRSDLIRLGIIHSPAGLGPMDSADPVFGNEEIRFNLVENFFVDANSKEPRPTIRYRLEDYVPSDLPDSVMLSAEYRLKQYIV